MVMDFPDPAATHKPICLASPPASGCRFLHRLLTAARMTNYIAHSPPAMWSWYREGVDRYLILVRDWRCSLNSVDPGRTPLEEGTLGVLRSYHEDPEEARRLAYRALIFAVCSTGHPWRFVTYESLLMHPEGVISEIADWTLSDPPDFSRVWSDVGNHPVSGNARTYPDSAAPWRPSPLTTGRVDPTLGT